MFAGAIELLLNF